MTLRFALSASLFFAPIRALPALRARLATPQGGLGLPPRRPAGFALGEAPRPRRQGWAAGVAARNWLAAAWRRHRSRQFIGQLDPHLLRDIGVTYAEAEHEANRPFWR
ncbi:MAG: DUF1127 domain-containing protein [Rhodospirillales bacterium]|nr:DUF1127 domain-containing protein [Rhodospirillales bacterium]